MSGAATLGFAHDALSDTGVLALYAALFAPYLGLLYITWRPDRTFPLWPFVATAILVRLVLLPAEPLLSDDIFRYVWDGRVGLNGINPFVHPPDADALASLRDSTIWENVNHPSVPTIYPPGAQFLFEFNAWLGGVASLKTLFALIEAGAVALCGFILRNVWERRELLVAFIIYALNPLVFVETAWSGHLDVVAWGLLTAGLLTLVYRTSLRSAVAAGGLVGLAVATKFLGLLAIPLAVIPLFHRADGRVWKRRLIFLAVVPVVVCLTYIPYMDAGSKLFSGFSTYAASWQGNDGAFRAVAGLSASTLEAWAPESMREGDEVLVHFEAFDELARDVGWTKEWNGKIVPNTTFTADQIAATVAKLTGAFVMGLVLLWWLTTGGGLISGMLALLLALFFFAPVLHPWYVAWLLPLAAVERRFRATAVTFSFLVLAAYIAWWSARNGGAWYVPNWAVMVEYGVVAGVFAVDRRAL